MIGLIVMLLVIAAMVLYVASRILAIKDDESIYMSTDEKNCSLVHSRLWVNGVCPLGCTEERKG